MSRFRTKYESFKEKHFLEQNLRLFNVTLSVFALWNFVRYSFEALNGTRQSFSVLVFLFAGVLGIFCAGTILLCRSRTEHLIFLPFGLIVFLLSENERPLYAVIFVALLTLITLTLVRVVIASANRVNRF